MPSEQQRQEHASNQDWPCNLNASGALRWWPAMESVELRIRKKTDNSTVRRWL